jgi:hypothetical protein
MRAVFVHADERDMLVNTLAVAIGQSFGKLGGDCELVGIR